MPKYIWEGVHESEKQLICCWWGSDWNQTQNTWQLVVIYYHPLSEGHSRIDIDWQIQCLHVLYNVMNATIASTNLKSLRLPALSQNSEDTTRYNCGGGERSIFVADPSPHIYIFGSSPSGAPPLRISDGMALKIFFLVCYSILVFWRTSFFFSKCMFSVRQDRVSQHIEIYEGSLSEVTPE